MQDKSEGTQNQNTHDPLKGGNVHSVESTPWCMACDGPHSPYQCVMAQGLNKFMRGEDEPTVNMFEYILETDYESLEDEASEYVVSKINVNCHEQLTIDWHPTLNVVIIEDQEVHLRRPSEEKVKNLTKVAIAKAKHNHNLRSSKNDRSQGMPGSLFFKETSSKRSTENKKTAKDSQAKGDQSSSSAKSNIADTTGCKSKTTGDKRIGRQKEKKVKAHVESNANNIFDMTQALMQMKVSVPLIELLKIKEHREVAFSLISSISDGDDFSKKGNAKKMRRIKNKESQNFMWALLSIKNHLKLIPFMSHY